MSSPGPSNETQHEVEVDKRALVNILARYPGQFDLLRELIQNADDALSTTVELHFETVSVPAGEVRGISELVVHKWIIKNKGRFKKEDWERLGKIAAGNTDSTKVGAFGVGFFSVLSKSDRPLVKSGGKSLQFYKAEDGRLCKEETSDQADDGWTSIELELKEQEVLPVLDELAGFLISSVALLAHIHTISVYLDLERLLHITKERSGQSLKIPIPKHLIRTSPKQALRVDYVNRTAQTITIDAKEWAFPLHLTSSSPPDYGGDVLVAREKTHPALDDPLPTPTTPVTRGCEITHDLYTATISDIMPSHSEIKQGVNSSLKSLPRSFKCKAVYFNSEQRRRFAGISKSPMSQAHLFKSFVPEKNGRFFIGQSTNQTTGIELHFSSHYLPTMERGAIDLANGQIAVWNKEVLWVSGLLARIVYEEDMRVAESKGERAVKFGLETMARFAFGPTAPHSGVSQILQDAFFTCSPMESKPKPKPPFPVVSNTGICCMSNSQFRQTKNELSFLKMYRVLHADIHPHQYREIIKRYGTPPFTFSDIVDEFANGVTQETMQVFFNWWQGVKRAALSLGADVKKKALVQEFCKQFALRGVLRMSKGVDIPLKTVKYYTCFPIDNDLSHPNSIYIDVSSGVPTRDALECFGWTQLSLVEWLGHASSAARHLAKHGDANVGRRLLRALMQFALGSELNRILWLIIASLVGDIKCIPTQMGLVVPSESYFDEADICRQLPVAKVRDFLDIPGIYTVDRGYQSVTPDVVSGVLALLGVQTEMGWEDLVSSLEKSASEESNDRLLRFLAKRGMITLSQAADLTKKGIFCSLDHGRRPTTELHMPNDKIRKLGLPVLALPQNSPLYEALCSHDPAVSCGVERFLGDIGFQSCPDLHVLIKSAAAEHEEIRETALRYFLDHREKHYVCYRADDFACIAFIPTECGSRACFNEVFVSPGWKELGFKQVCTKLRRSDRLKLGIKEHPPIDMIIEHFRYPDQTLPNHDTAKLWFELLSSHGEFSLSDLRERLSKIPFVPVTGSGSSSETSTTEYFAPRDCFVASLDSKKILEHHHNIFPFVDFGPKGNNFLESCCAKNSPDATDITRKILEEPQTYLAALGTGADKLYTDDLRTIASQLDTIPKDTREKMQNAQMFLSFQQQTKSSKLSSANQVMIGDWESRDFGSHVFLAPDEEVIKKMYYTMGSQFLGAYVRYDIDHSGPLNRGIRALTREQIIRGVTHFMSRQDQCKTKDVLLDDKGVKSGFGVKVCKSIKTTKTFEPPPQFMAGGVVVGDPQDCCAGFDTAELTLWLVENPTQMTQLYNDVAVALCHVLLVTFSSDDVMRLASLITLSEEEFRRMYPEEPKSVGDGHGSSTSAEKKEIAKPWKSVEIKLTLPPPMARIAERLGIRLRPKPSHTYTAAPEEEVQNAVKMSCASQSSGREDFSKPSQLHRTTFKKGNNRCKEAHKIILEERENREGQLRFFFAHNAIRRDPPRAALDEFSTLITNLAEVFQLPAETACYIFWADTNDDLMAFNRDQKFLFFNLFHYHKFHFNLKVSSEEKRVVTEWFLIMAHEIAHNRSQDHDEYHGSLTSRLVFTYLPALQERFPFVA